MQWIIQDKFKLLKVIYLNEFVFDRRRRVALLHAKGPYYRF